MAYLGNKIVKYSNEQAKREIYNRLAMLAMCSKKWTFEGAPYIDTWTLNRLLFEQNHAVIVYDKQRKERPFIVGMLGTYYELDEYNRPVKWMMETINGKLQYPDCNDSNSVIIYASPVHHQTGSYYPTVHRTVSMFAHRLALIDNVKRINIQTQRTPYIATGTPENQINLQKIVGNLENGSDLIINSSTSELDEFLRVAELNAPYVADKLTDIEHDTYNQFYTFLGLNNSNVDKRERVNVEEVEANNEVIALYKFITMDPLEYAVKRMNDLWPELKAKVEVSVQPELMEKVVNDNGIDNRRTENS